MQKLNEECVFKDLHIQSQNCQVDLTSRKSNGMENLQHFQPLPTSLKCHPSNDSIDTDCTTNSPDHSDKHSLKYIDEAVETQEDDLPDTRFQKIDLQPLEFSQPLLEGVKKACLKVEGTLLAHFRQAMKIDKYLRLVSSIIKTRRAYAPQSSLNGLYKELILARRVIRWQSKYDTIISFKTQQEGLGMKVFKIMQLSGDIVDLAAFWIRIVNKGTNNRAAFLQQLEQAESNFYFAECCIWLPIYSYRYFMLRKKEGKGQEKERQVNKRKMVENMLKVVKYIFDVLTSYNNSSLRRVGGQINHKLAGLLTFLSSAIGIFLLWR